MVHILVSWLHWLGMLLHAHAAATAGCAPKAADAPSIAFIVQRAEMTSGGYAVALNSACRHGSRVLSVTTVAPRRLAVVLMARKDGTLLGLRWQSHWQRWLHDDEMQAVRGERPSLDLVQALRRVSPYGMVTTARLRYEGSRPLWSFTVDNAGSNQIWKVESVKGRVLIASNN
ncbi:MAG: hypothetical protein ACYCUL_09090 [Metallibacterium scheffleri]